MSQNGLTLVELMVALLIIGLIATAASPFTTVWVKDARANEGAAALEEAVGRAKSAAMRNAARIIGAAPASKLCLSATKTTISLVVPADSTQQLTCDLTPIWSTNISEIVSVKTIKTDIESDWSCSCFDNKGLPTKDGAQCNSCSDSLQFKFTHDGHSGADEGDKRNFY